MASAQKTQVLVVDDSRAMRRLVTEALTSDPSIEVIDTAAHGQIALNKVHSLRPDLVVLDLEMPVMDGREATEEIRRVDKTLPIIIFTATSENGARATFDALRYGASDFVAKPKLTVGREQTRAAVRDALLPRVKALVERRRREGSTNAAAREVSIEPVAQPPVLGRQHRVDIVTIASSTGGPQALSEFIPHLPEDLAVPVVCVQHMPRDFTQVMAERLNGESALRVVEAKDRDAIEAGGVWIAPGGMHIRLAQSRGSVLIRTDHGPEEHFCRPAADVLLRSVPPIYERHVLSVVITGMGRDGCAGSRLIREAGGQVIAQDEASSVVWGMPGEVVKAGLADQQLPISQIAANVAERVSLGR